jgi:hypothetical protein
MTPLPENSSDDLTSFANKTPLCTSSLPAYNSYVQLRNAEATGFAGHRSRVLFWANLSSNVAYPHSREFAGDKLRRCQGSSGKSGIHHEVVELEDAGAAIRGEYWQLFCLWDIRRKLSNHAVNLCKHEGLDARHVIPRILSSTTIALLELQTRTACLNICAYQADSGHDDQGLAFSSDRYELPSLAANRIYLTGHMECSPVSLSAQDATLGAHHLLADGEGIVAITLETLYVPVEGQQASELPPNFSGWTSTTACALVQPFHATVQRKLAQSKAIISPTLRSYDELAKGTLSWLMRHPVRPNRDSICGYRLYISGDAEIDFDEQGIPRLDRQSLRMYDFTPMHVKKAIHREGGEKKPLRFSENLNILDLRAYGSEVCMDSRPPCQVDYNRVVVTKSAPATVQSVFRDGPARYATESPYILTTKRIRMNPYHVCQVTQDHMLVCQVSVTFLDGIHRRTHRRCLTSASFVFSDDWAGTWFFDTPWLVLKLRRKRRELGSCNSSKVNAD